MEGDTKKRRILIFSTAYFPLVGGAEVAIKAITDRLGDEFEFDMVTSRIQKDLPKFEKVGNVNVYRVGNGNALDKYRLALVGHKFAKKLHDKNKYNAVWGIMASYGGFSASAFKKKNKNVPFLLTLQEGDPIKFIKRRALPMYIAFKRIFKRADYVQTISIYLAKWARSMGARGKLQIIPNGVNLDDFYFTSFSRHSKTTYESGFLDDSVKKEWKESLFGDFYKEGDKFLITTSRLVKKNAVDDVIKSLKFLPSNIKFIILGVGGDKDKLVKLAKELGVSNRVKFLGQIAREDISKYLNISDIFIRPSLSEGLGNSFLEAMMACLPVIGTEVGGIPDFLKDKETGLFVKVRNPKDIAEKVKFLLDPANEELKNRIIKNAQELVIKNYDWNLIAKKMRSIFNKIST